MRRSPDSPTHFDRYGVELAAGQDHHVQLLTGWAPDR